MKTVLLRIQFDPGVCSQPVPIDAPDSNPHVYGKPTPQKQELRPDCTHKAAHALEVRGQSPEFRDAHGIVVAEKPAREPLHGSPDDFRRKTTERNSNKRHCEGYFCEQERPVKPPHAAITRCQKIRLPLPHQRASMVNVTFASVTYAIQDVLAEKSSIRIRPLGRTPSPAVSSAHDSPPAFRAPAMLTAINERGTGAGRRSRRAQGRMKRAGPRRRPPYPSLSTAVRVSGAAARGRRSRAKAWESGSPCRCRRRSRRRRPGPGRLAGERDAGTAGRPAIEGHVHPRRSQPQEARTVRATTYTAAPVSSQWVNAMRVPSGDQGL